MANSLSASFPEIWADAQQRKFERTNVGIKVADMSFRSQMSYGDTLNRTYRSSRTVQTYTPGTDITMDDLTDTNESLTVNNMFATGFYVDDFEQIQDKYDIAKAYGEDDAVKLSNQVDASILGEVFNATSVVDDSDFGGTAGNGVSVSTSNILKLFGVAKRKLAKQNLPTEDYFAVISPELEELILQYTAGRDTMLGDTTQDNGYLGKFLGFKLYRSNQTAGSAVLALATQPTNGDTVVINGQTFTFVSSIGTTAGNVLIGGDVDVTRANLATLINAPGTTTANGVALTGTALREFTANASATNDNTADTLTVQFNGIGVLEVSEDLTDGTDTWTTALQLQHCMFGHKGTPTCVVQSDPRIRISDAEKRLGDYIKNGVLYGTKTFDDNAKMMVNVKIASSSYSEPAVS